jgi:hypothetical protein
MDNPLRILHLEDDPLDREIVEANLAEGGVSCRIRHVETRESFLKAIEEEEFDIILADYSLPAFDGLTALEFAKQKRPEVPFIFVSGTMGEDPAIETLTSGATDYVLKQKLSRLVPALRRALAEANNRKDIVVKERALHDVLHRLQLQVRFMPLACVVWDPDYRIREWNPAAETIFGWSEAEACGSDIRKLIVPPEEHGSRSVLFEKILAEDVGGRTISINSTKSGKKISCEWFRTYLKDEAGNLVGVLSMTNDITERIRLEKQLQAAQRMESVGTLAGGIAHDFNNALTGIIGYADLLRIRLGGDPLALADLDEISRAAERAATLTRQLLTFARRQVLEPVNLNLRDVVKDLMRFFVKVAGEQIEVKTSLAPDTPTIAADRGQIEQILMNLIVNARDAMAGGGQLLVETGEVFLEDDYIEEHQYMERGRYALLEVSDTGIGMDEATRERAFEPFFTTKGPDKGTGLGLSVVYGIVKQHKGSINLYSEPGKGSTFKIYIPAIEAAPEVRVAVKPEPIRGGSETILLAEDEEPIRALAERILKEIGYTVLSASNGEEAIEVFRRHKETISLAVLDVVMPRMSGKAAFETIHKLNPLLKVIFMSGYTANAIHQSFVLTTGLPYLSKPFGPSSLARNVREVLDGK